MFTTSMNTHEAYISLNMMEGMGPVTAASLEASLGSMEAVFTASKSDLMTVDGVGARSAERILSERERVDGAAEAAKAERMGVRILTPVDDQYPDLLREIHDPPLALYVRGNVDSLSAQGLAVVGTRRPTHYGRDCSEQLSRQLASARYSIISGLARGIDTAAHRGALKAQGVTVGVLGSALDQFYPAENIELAAEMCERGCVISEFPFGRSPDKTTFPMRNRIVAGLSRGVLVVEAGIKSGAMITVNQALDQGKAVFAVPGRIDQPSTRGTHYLIKNGAQLVDDVDDIFSEFDSLIPDRPRGEMVSLPTPCLTEDEDRVISSLALGEQSVDEVARETGLSVSQVGATLIRLEMKRLIRMLPGRIVEKVEG